jgi:hypothetical protein
MRAKSVSFCPERNTVKSLPVFSFVVVHFKYDPDIFNAVNDKEKTTLGSFCRIIVIADKMVNL